MASKLNLNIEQGASFSTTLTLTDDNGVTCGLDGYAGQSHMRRSYSSLNFFALDVDVTDITGGIITISKGATGTTGTQGITSGRYVYDLEVTNNSTGDVQRIVEGVITVMPEAKK